MILLYFNAKSPSERAAAYQERYRRKLQPHRWFAWRPVIVKSHGLVWLEDVCRVGMASYNGGYWWEYSPDRDGLERL